MVSERSSQMFSLATEFGIPLERGREEPMTDDAFLEFRHRYLDWSKARDAVLATHLSEATGLLRVYVPYSRRAFNVAA